MGEEEKGFLEYSAVCCLPLSEVPLKGFPHSVRDILPFAAHSFLKLKPSFYLYVTSEQLPTTILIFAKLLASHKLHESTKYWFTVLLFKLQILLFFRFSLAK